MSDTSTDFYTQQAAEARGPEPQGPPKRKRKKLKRTLIASGASLVLLAGAAVAGSYVFVNNMAGSVHRIDVAALTAKVSLETTNGGVSLTVPDDIKADVSASCTNGGISISGLKMETTESTRRRIEGKVNGGGSLIDLRTTNGGIRLRARSSPA